MIASNETKFKQNTDTAKGIAEKIHAILSWAYTNGYGVALWREPTKNKLHVIFDYGGGKQIQNIQEAEEAPFDHFIIHPFSSSSRLPICQLKVDSKISLEIATDEPLAQDQEAENNELLEQIVKHTGYSENLSKPYYFSQTPEKCIADKKQHFLNTVNQGINAIKQGKLQKIVPSRTKQIELSAHFNLADCFLKILQNHPNAFVSLSSSPLSGTWIGATPELLVSQDRQDIFSTVALAGTQPYNAGKTLKNISWKQKEIEEQALVSRYVINCFKHIRLREFEENGPKTIKAGNLFHLRTDFSVDMKATNFPKLTAVMLELLHPTSAVCGMPRAESLDFLERHERYDRGYFAGFIGPYKFEGEKKLYVNLRCASLTEKSATLYAGAGVTVDSNAEKEWRETNWKCNIIGKFLLHSSPMNT